MYVFSYFPFGFEGRMSDLIVSVPDHCLSFYFTHTIMTLIHHIKELVYHIIRNIHNIIRCCRHIMRPCHYIKYKLQSITNVVHYIMICILTQYIT